MHIDSELDACLQSFIIEGYGLILTYFDKENHCEI